MRGGVQSLGVVPYTLSGNRTWNGVQTFNAAIIVNGVSGSGATMQLKSVAGQTGNALEIYNSGGTRVAYFDNAGNFVSSGATSYSSTQIVQGSTSVVAFSVKGAAGATADLQQWQNSAGTVLLGINASGNLYATGGLTLTSLTVNGVIYGQQAAGNGDVLFVGNDAKIADINSADTLGILSQGTPTQGGIQLGTGGPLLFGQNGFLGVAPTGNRTPGAVVDASSGGTSMALQATTSGANRTANFVDTGTSGVNLRLLGNGSTNPSKTLRVTNGSLQIINDAYSSVLWNMDNTGKVTAYGAMALNYGTNTEVIPANVNVYVNTASSGASGGRLAFTSNGPTGNDGAYIEYVPATAGNTANQINISGNGAANLAYLGIHSTTTQVTGHFLVSTNLGIRTDNTTVDPGYPWIRGDGNFLAINPHGSGQLYLAWDVTNQTNIGGTLSVTHGIQFSGGGQVSANPGISADGTNLYLGANNGSVVFRPQGAASGTNQGWIDNSGNFNVPGNIMGHTNYQVVETGNSSPLHIERATGSSGSVASGQNLSMGITFARAYGATPATSGNGQTSAGNPGNVYAGGGTFSTTSCTVYLRNNDGNTQTLSNGCIIAVG